MQSVSQLRASMNAIAADHRLVMHVVMTEGITSITASDDATVCDIGIISHS